MKTIYHFFYGINIFWKKGCHQHMQGKVSNDQKFLTLLYEDFL